ncbi:unannotated protein [freshwater metagenome]|uniref:Unannotated protein n=1 Tax=freshwater metagenome TaxID=449393 RepID=A0A6J6B6I6_9ZZZZ|nr:glycosyltransferase [Actinomycetota bacterium]MTA63298.1 glycosyltransferase [Actinomycetota bacterium]
MKLLVITPRFPYPLERGDKLRAYHQIRQLSQSHEVTLVALSEGPVDPEAFDKVAADCCSNIHVISRSRVTTVVSTLLAVLRGQPLQVGYFNSASAAREIDQIIAKEKPDHIYCQLIRTASYGRNNSIPRTLDYQDAFSASMQRRADQSPSWLRWIFALEARRIARYEERAFAWFDSQVIISEQDRDLLGFAGSEKVQIVRNGVDTEFFSPHSTPTDQRDLLFVGNMGYPPNVNAVTTLVSEILPLVREARPQTDLLIAGARPTKAVQQLAGAGIEVSGWLDDIRSAYERGRIMVVPLVIGAGLQNKILEAMSMGVPCITTELVNRAIGAVPDEEVLIASSAQEFAEQTLRLLESPELYSRISAGGLQLVQSRYSWQAVGETLSVAFTH